MKKSGGVFGEGEYGDNEEELFVRERRSLDILSVKKEARLSARALAEVQVGRGEEELRCDSLFIVSQRHLLLSEDEETMYTSNLLYDIMYITNLQCTHEHKHAKCRLLIDTKRLNIVKISAYQNIF